jgi:hypothetical protein
MIVPSCQLCAVKVIACFKMMMIQMSPTLSETSKLCIAKSETVLSESSLKNTEFMTMRYLKFKKPDNRNIKEAPTLWSKHKEADTKQCYELTQSVENRNKKPVIIHLQNNLQDIYTAYSLICHMKCVTPIDGDSYDSSKARIKSLSRFFKILLFTIYI